MTANPVDYSAAKTVIAFAERCGKHGAEVGHFQLGIDDPLKAERIAGFLKAGAPLTWPNPIVGPVYGETSAKRALDIIKVSYGPAVIEKHFPWRFTGYQHSLLETLPFTESFLESIAFTHGIVAKHPSASVMGIKKGMPKKAPNNLWYPEDWYHDKAQEFAHEGPGNGWGIIRLDEAPDSWDKDYPTSLECLSPIEIPALCCEGTLFAEVHCLETEQRIFTKRWIRFRDRSASGFRVYARFDSGGWSVGYWDDGYARPDLGLASALRTS